MYRRIARIALALALLAATQLALAGQLCSSVMASGTSVGNNEHLRGETATGVAVAAESKPCYGSAPMPARTCIGRIDASGWSAAALHGNSLPTVAALPSMAYTTVVALDRSPISSFRPAGVAGPPLPAYIRLRRFLS